MISPRLVLLCLFLSQSILQGFAWCNAKRNIWRKCKAAVLTAATVTSIVVSPLQTPIAAGETSAFLNSPTLVSTMEDSSLGKDEYTFDKKLLKNLQPPTEETPQVMLPPEILTQLKGKSPVVEGLVFLVDQEKRPGPTDTLVLTARRLSKSNSEILAGAKIPVSKTRFPMNFRMFKENALSGKTDEWSEAIENSDVLVSARICPDGGPVPCSDEQSTLKGNGMSKVVRNLPGATENVNVRAAASVPLE